MKAHVKIIDGEPYLNTTLAARTAGFTREYINLLCREGKLETKLVGKFWYVRASSIDLFKKQQLLSTAQRYQSVAEGRKRQYAESQRLLSQAPAPRAMAHVAPETMRSALTRRVSRRLRQVMAMQIAGAVLLVVVTFGTAYQATGPKPFVAIALHATQQTAAAGSMVGTFFHWLGSLLPKSAPEIVVQYIPVPAAASSSVATTPARTIVHETVFETTVQRIIQPERVTVSGVTEAYIDARLLALKEDVLAHLPAPTVATSPQVASPMYVGSAPMVRIDSLTNTTLTNPTITGGSVTATDFSGTIGTSHGGTGTTTSPTYGQLLLGNSEGGYSLVATSSLGITGGGGVSLTDANTWDALQLFSGGASTTRLSVFDTLYIGDSSTTTIRGSATSTFAAAVDAPAFSGAGLSMCSGSYDKLLYDSSTGHFSCGTDQSGSGGASDGNWLFFNNGALRPATTTSQILIGTNATTTTMKLEVAGGAKLDYASTTALSATSLFSTTWNGYTPANLLASGFSTTSADYWKSANNFFSTTSVAYWESTQQRWATTSASYFLSQNLGAAFSTTSTDYWLTQKSTTNLAEGSNLYFTQNRVAGVLAGTTTDALAQGTTNKYYSSILFAADLAGTTTTALAEGSNLYFTNNRVATVLAGTTTDALAEGASHLYYTDARVNTVLNASTTIARTANAINWSALQTFSNGFIANASSTISGDLTVAGNSTTTGSTYLAGALTTGGSMSLGGTLTTGGSLIVQGTGTSTFAGNIGITGSIIPSANNTYSLGSAAFTWKDLYVGPGSIYVNGQKVLQTDPSQNVVVTSDVNQNLVLQTSGTGNLELNPSGTGQVLLKGGLHVSAGKTITTTDGSALPFSFGIAPGNLSLAANTLSATNVNGGILITPNGNGGTYITSGNVGIGNTNAQQKLNVQGEVAGQYFTATSSTASLFPYASSTALSATIGYFSTATTSVLNATTGNLAAVTAGTLNLTAGTTTSLFSTTASSTNLYSQSASVGSLSLASALGATSGGTGLSTITQNSLLLGGAGNTWTQIGTSTLGLPTFADLGSYLSLASWYATTTDALDEGSTNLYFTTTRVNDILNASTTIPHTAGTAYGDLLYWTGSTWATRATSTLGISGGGGFSFTPTTNFATNVVSTSTPIWFQNGLFASSTSRLAALAIDAGSYLNFGATTGSSGYGFRDNGGTLEFKNSGGTWNSVNTATSGPSFFVNKNSVNQTGLSGWTKLTWATEVFDTNNNFANDRFTPTVAGKYLISGSALCSDNNVTYCQVSIYKNGSGYVVSDNHTPSGGDIFGVVSAIVDMNGTTDYVELYANIIGGSTSIHGGVIYTYFQGALLAPVNATAGGWQNDGTQSILADSTDKVGIGTSTPWSKLSIYGDLHLDGASRYINFGGSATGTSGYGLRDNAGTIEFKNSGGSWTGIGSGTGSGSGGGQLLATYATSSPGSNVSVNFNGTAGSSPSFSAGTLTLPSNTSYMVVEVQGGGGGGGGGGTGGAAGTDGGSSCFGTNATACTTPILSATGGQTSQGGGGGQVNAGAAGTGSGGDVNVTGGRGINGSTSANSCANLGGAGGSSVFAGGTFGGLCSNGADAPAGSGAGGGGGGTAASSVPVGAGGSAGGYAKKLITPASGSYYFTVGVGGSSGAAGASSGYGGVGGSGRIVISVYTTGISQGAIGAGAAGYLPYFTSSTASTSLSATSTLFLSTSGNFGIGTTTPWQMLTVVGTSSMRTILPEANLTYDLGSSSYRWNNLWAGTLNIGTSTFSLTSDSSSNLGFFTAASGGGTQAMTLTSGGSLGIGTTSPLFPLTVQGAGTSYNGISGYQAALVANSTAGPQLLFTGNGTYDGRDWALVSTAGANTGIGGAGKFAIVDRTVGTNATRMLIDTSGNVGIGTTTPSSLLNVFSNSTYGNIAIGGDNNKERFQTESNAAPVFQGGMYNGTYGARTAVTSGQVLAYFQGGGFDGTIQRFNQARMNVVATENHSSTNQGAGLYFQTTPNGSTFSSIATRMVVDSTGNVGIGTTTPVSKLSVGNSIFSYAQSNIALIGDGGSANALGLVGDSNGGTNLNFYGNASSTRVAVVQSAGVTGTSGGLLRFYTSSDAGAITERMRIDSSGNVGIGTTSSAYPLYVERSTAATNIIGRSFDSTSYAGFGALNDLGNFVNMVRYGSAAAGTDLGVTKAGIGVITSNSGALAIGTRGADSLYLSTNNTAQVSVLSGGNVGIGTTTPGAKLDIYSNGANAAGLRMLSGATDKYNVFQMGRIATEATFGISPATDNWVTGSAAGDAFLRTESSNKLFLSSGGNLGLVVSGSNVGIGTTSPRTLLFGGSVTNQFGFEPRTDGANIDGVGAGNLVRWGGYYNGNPIPGAAISLFAQGSAGQRGGIGFATKATDDSTNQPAYSMVINPSGNVGIGTVSPAAKLDVAGGIKMTDTTEFLQQSIRPYDEMDANAMAARSSGFNQVSCAASANVYTCTSSGNDPFFTTGLTVDPANHKYLAIRYKTGTGFTASTSYTGTVFETTAYNSIQFIIYPDGKWHTAIIDISSLPAGARGLRIDFPDYPAAGGMVFYLSYMAVGNIGSGYDAMMAKQGNVGIGTTNPTEKLTVGGSILTTGGMQIGSPSDSSGLINIKWIPSGQQGINMMGNDENYSGAAIRFMNSGGGASGYIFQQTNSVTYNTSSDRRKKENIATSTLGLSALLKLPVRDFNFVNDPTGASTTGFIAQELRLVFPWAVTTNGDDGEVPLGASSTPWSVDYGRITPLIVKAVQDIANLADTFKEKLVAWFADAANGIGDFFANRVHTKELCVSDESGAETCITKARLDSLLAGASQSVTAPTPTPIDTQETGAPPEIQLNGENPAVISVGVTYSDLGALITGPTDADRNLGVSASIDGGPEMSPEAIQFDTSLEGEHTITYAAHNEFGTTTVTRTLIIEAAAGTDSAPIEPVPAE